jgi:hypothetical protein
MFAAGLWMSADVKKRKAIMATDQSRPGRGD